MQVNLRLGSTRAVLSQPLQGMVFQRTSHHAFMVCTLIAVQPAVCDPPDSKQMESSSSAQSKSKLVCYDSIVKGEGFIATGGKGHHWRASRSSGSSLRPVGPKR